MSTREIMEMLYLRTEPQSALGPPAREAEMRRTRAAGFLLVVIGLVFIALYSRPAQHSTAGVVAGVLFTLAGFVRILRSRHG